MEGSGGKSNDLENVEPISPSGRTEVQLGQTKTSGSDLVPHSMHVFFGTSSSCMSIPVNVRQMTLVNHH